LSETNSRRNGRKTEWPGNGIEDSKERRGDRGEQTHAKPPPTAAGDLGSGDRTPPSPLRKRGEHQIVAGASGGRGKGQLKIQLMIQRVQDVRGGKCIVLWDSGAQVSLVTHDYARGAGFRRRPASIRNTGVGAGSGGESSVQYKALLRRRDGSVEEILPYGVDRITGNATSLNLSKAKARFPAVASTLESPAGPIQLLIGLDHMEEAPREEERAQGVALYSSKFGTGYVTGGNMTYQPGQEPTSVRVLSCRTTLFNPPEFILAEVMGTELPRRCPACRNCKECQFRMDSLTFKENTEYEVILSKLHRDVERRQWIAGYPFNTMVEKLIDNYGQARGCMSRMETRLLKKGRIAEFNRQFQDNVNRGVFKPIPKEEADRYKGAVNYISMVEAFKTGPFATTPLRICMNSSMRQPQPSGGSLNDCLLKGPPALADLYTVTLGIREHKVAFTKDISKFYQCEEADEAAQHVRRILWRFGDRSREPTIFVTKRVNYGDRPAGCIAIAAVRETVDRFGEGKETAAWFLKNRTYVEDATRGASSMEEAKKVSQDMEDILKNGRFRFKETVMAGDPLEEGGELRKVLGLRWDTQEDKICVDIKLNYGEKVKGAYLEEDAPLTDPESALPQVITRRVLWRVAQSQKTLLASSACTW
jgi:hypothetical protein